MRGIQAGLTVGLAGVVLGMVSGCDRSTEPLLGGGESAGVGESVGENQSALLTLANNRRLLGYFAQWSIYGGHGMYNPCSVPFTKYTHINYAFVGTRTTANPNFNLGGLSSTANPYTGSTATQTTGNYDSHFKWLKGLDYHADEGHTNCANGTYQDGTAIGPISYGGTSCANGRCVVDAGNAGLFKRARDTFGIKFIISFGGWTKGAGFPVIAADATKRTEFCDDVVRVIRRWNADGADFDWEFPGSSRAPDPSDSNDEGMPYGSTADKANLTALLQQCRTALNNAGAADGRTYDLTAAVSAGHNNLDQIDWAAINTNNSLNMVNIMTYDFHGGFDAKTGHQSALYMSSHDTFPDPIHSEFNASWAFNYLKNTKAFPASKLSIGMAFYTRGWNNVSGGWNGLGGSGGGTLPGDWGIGGQGSLNKIYQLKGAGGWTEIWDPDAHAHFLYSSSQATLYTYDSLQSIEDKINFCKSNGCGGMFNWEIDGDATVGGANYPMISRAVQLMSSSSCVPGTCPANSCGSVSDGCGGQLSCGTCAAGTTCSGNQCVSSCTQTTCSAQGKNCGSIADGCGGTLTCGTCAANQTCTNNVCVANTTESPFATVNIGATPVTIQAENYDNGGEGVAYHDTDPANQGNTFRTDGVDIQPTTDTDGGNNVGWTAAGEWLNYTVSVQTAANYNFDVRYANQSGAAQTIKVYMDGTVIGTVSAPDTAGWQNWSTVSFTNVALSAGSHIMKVEFTTGGVNLNWVKVTQVAAADTTAPSTPGTPSASGASSSQVTMSWTASTDNVGVTGYRVFRNDTQIATVAGTSYTLTGLQPGSTYAVKVSAYDAAGNTSATSAVAYGSTTGTCAGTTLWQNTNYGGYGVCVTPGSYALSALTNMGIKNDDVSSLRVPSGYSVTMYWDDNFGGATLVKTADDSTLVDDNWNDAMTSVVVASTADTSAPSTPGSLATSGTTSSAITLSWAASTDNVGVTGYDVSRDGTVLATVTGTSYTFSGLTASHTYTLGVKAKDAAGNSSALASVSATTSAGGGGGGTCAAAYNSANWSSYAVGTQVSTGGHNYTCSNLNCQMCGTYSSCAPGGSGCPWGAVWTDNGACQ
jgi:chitinase